MWRRAADSVPCESWRVKDRKARKTADLALPEEDRGCMRDLKGHLRALLGEKRKIEAFKRELPLCMTLLEEAVRATRKQMGSGQSLSGLSRSLALESGDNEGQGGNDEGDLDGRALHDDDDHGNEDDDDDEARHNGVCGRDGVLQKSSVKSGRMSDDRAEGRSSGRDEEERELFPLKRRWTKVKDEAESGERGGGSDFSGREWERERERSWEERGDGGASGVDGRGWRPYRMGAEEEVAYREEPMQLKTSGGGGTWRRRISPPVQQQTSSPKHIVWASEHSKGAFHPFSRTERSSTMPHTSSPRDWPNPRAELPLGPRDLDAVDPRVPVSWRMGPHDPHADEAGPVTARMPRGGTGDLAWPIPIRGQDLRARGEGGLGAERDKERASGGAHGQHHGGVTGGGGREGDGSARPGTSRGSWGMEGGGGGRGERKARRCWSSELHRHFVAALNQLGGVHAATPKQIRELMNVEGLTNDEVKSHLQKYRLHSRRSSPSRSSAPSQVVVLGGLWLPEYPNATGGPLYNTSQSPRKTQQEQACRSQLAQPSAPNSPRRFQPHGTSSALFSPPREGRGAGADLTYRVLRSPPPHPNDRAVVRHAYAPPVSLAGSSSGSQGGSPREDSHNLLRMGERRDPGGEDIGQRDIWETRPGKWDMASKQWEDTAQDGSRFRPPQSKRDREREALNLMWPQGLNKSNDAERHSQGSCRSIRHAPPPDFDEPRKVERSSSTGPSMEGEASVERRKSAGLDLEQSSGPQRS